MLRVRSFHIALSRNILLCLAITLWFAPKAIATTKPILSSPVTHSDWMLFEPDTAWGTEGVHQILDRAKQSGWDRVYWRCLDGGRALYPSNILEPLHYLDEENYLDDNGYTALREDLEQYDWGSFDAFAEAIDYGRQIGVEVHAWLSINEDDHAYGWTSNYTRAHPESRWVKRDGTVFHSQQSFAFPEVRDYKLAVLGEVMAYQPDGIFFDWIRTGDVRDDPHTDSNGVALYGYEAPNIDRFTQLYGVDPYSLANGDDNWVRVRAEPQTIFMREAHNLIKTANPNCQISAMVQNSDGYRGTATIYDGNLRGLLVDLETWANEGLIDDVVAAGYYRTGGNAETAYLEMVQETQGQTNVWVYGWLNQNSFTESTALAERLGASEVLLWESNYIGLAPDYQDFVDAMHGYPDPDPNYVNNSSFEVGGMQTDIPDWVDVDTNPDSTWSVYQEGPNAPNFFPEGGLVGYYFALIDPESNGVYFAYQDLGAIFDEGKTYTLTVATGRRQDHDDLGWGETGWKISLNYADDGAEVASLSGFIAPGDGGFLTDHSLLYIVGPEDLGREIQIRIGGATSGLTSAYDNVRLTIGSVLLPGDANLDNSSFEVGGRQADISNWVDVDHNQIYSDFSVYQEGPNAPNFFPEGGLVGYYFALIDPESNGVYFAYQDLGAIFDEGKTYTLTVATGRRQDHDDLGWGETGWKISLNYADDGAEVASLSGFIAPGDGGFLTDHSLLYIVGPEDLGREIQIRIGGATSGLTSAYDNVRLTVVGSEWIPGDANHDGKVDGEDAATLAINWLTTSDATWYMGDFNEDGAVDDMDATLMAANWQYGVTPAAVPEPGIFMLVLAGAACLAVGRLTASWSRMVFVGGNSQRTEHDRRFRCNRLCCDSRGKRPFQLEAFGFPCNGKKGALRGLFTL